MSGLSGAVPKHAKYVQGGLPVGLDSRRRTIRLIPQTGTGVYTPDGTNVIRIDIPPSLGFLDTQNSYLRFNIKVDRDMVDVRFPCFMDKNAMSWVDRFEVISNNGSVLESIHDYNLLVNLLHKATSPDDYRLTAGKLLDNQGSRAERMANLANTCGRQYCVGLDASGIFGGNTKYLPCQFIQGALTLEFSLASFNSCFVGRQPMDANGVDTSSSGSYSISNVEYVAECISFGQDYNYLFEQQLRSSGIDISYHSYRSHHHAITGGGETNIQLSQNSKSVKGVYCVIRGKDKIRSPKHESLSNYKSGNLAQYQFDLGGRLFPEFPISLENHGEASCYANNLNSFNQFRDQNSGSEITRSTFSATHNGGSVVIHRTDNSHKHNHLVTKRFHGYMVGSTNANIDAAGQYTADPGTGSADPFRKGGPAGPISTTFYFRPSNLFDLPDLKLGERVKIKFNNNTLDAAAAINTACNDTGYGTKGETDSYLYVVGVGLDVLVRCALKHDAGAGENGFTTLRGCVALACTRGRSQTLGGELVSTFANRPGDDDAYRKNAYLAEEIRGFSVSRLIGGGNGTDLDLGYLHGLVPGAGDHQHHGYLGPAACYIDVIPDDKDFYIGQSFEAHEEHDSLISGTDLTNTVPLHVNMRFDGADGKHEEIAQGDLLTAFIHYDSVLRIEPDGSVVSSM